MEPVATGSGATRSTISNAEIADTLESVASLLETQGDGVHRVRAYRNAAASVRRAARSLAELHAEEGLAGLGELPAVGKSIASTIAELLETGQLGMLARLQGQVSPEDLFATVPGIGEELAHRIHQELHVDTLEELELAAHDGRLERVPGFGPRRARAIREVLSSRLSRSARRQLHRFRGMGAHAAVQSELPSVATLLAVDAEYRRRAEAGELRTIAPRRFNPTGEAWLPILHEEREGWTFTALYSNSARAHDLGRTRDWVVLYYERDGQEGQCTVVTETHGELRGRRVVRGREHERS